MCLIEFFKKHTNLGFTYIWNSNYSESYRLLWRSGDTRCILAVILCFREDSKVALSVQNESLYWNLFDLQNYVFIIMTFSILSSTLRPPRLLLFGTRQVFCFTAWKVLVPIPVVIFSKYVRRLIIKVFGIFFIFIFTFCKIEEKACWEKWIFRFGLFYNREI